MRDGSGNVIRSPPKQPSTSSVKPLKSKSEFKSFADMLGTPGGGAPLVNPDTHGAYTHLPTTHLDGPSPNPTDIFGKSSVQAPPRLNDDEIRAKKEEHLDKKKYLRSLQDGIDERLKIVCYLRTATVT